jgi:predicted RNA-binding protein YlqC (UPF0109 family)
MRVDDNRGDPSLEPLVDPISAVEYDDDYEEENEGEAEDGVDDTLYAPTTDAAERLRGLVTYLAANLVDDPERVEVEARQRGGSVFISLRVPEEELGKVIGRGGRIARAMRTALMIAGSRNNVRASLDIED